MYIVAKGTITVEGAENRDKHNRNLDDLDIVMAMYNLLEYSKNYSKTSGCLWNYYKDI